MSGQEIPEKKEGQTRRTRCLHCELITNMMRAANLLVCQKKIGGGEISTLEAIKTVHETRKEFVQKLQNAALQQKLLKSTDAFYFQLIYLMSGQQGSDELSLGVLEKGYEATAAHNCDASL